MQFLRSPSKPNMTVYFVVLPPRSRLFLGQNVGEVISRAFVGWIRNLDFLSSVRIGLWLHVDVGSRRWFIHSSHEEEGKRNTSGSPKYSSPRRITHSQFILSHPLISDRKRDEWQDVVTWSTGNIESRRDCCRLVNKYIPVIGWGLSNIPSWPKLTFYFLYSHPIIVNRRRRGREGTGLMYWLITNCQSPYNWDLFVLVTTSEQKHQRACGGEF